MSMSDYDVYNKATDVISDLKIDNLFINFITIIINNNKIFRYLSLNILKNIYIF